MKLSIPAGTTSKRIAIFIQDSSSTTGAGLTGLVFNSSSLVCYQWIDTDGNVGGTSLTLQTATLGTWTTRGFKEKDATNMPGLYEFGIPDAALAAGVKWAVFMLKGATNMAPLPIEIEVTAVSNQDAVRGGMTALPNANAEAAGGLYTRGSGAGQIAQSTNGQVDVDAKKINSVATSSVTTINANVGQTQPVNFTGTGASALVKGDAVDWAGGAIPAVNVTGVPLVDLKYTLGTISPATAGSVRADAVTGAVGSVTGAVGSVTGNVGGNVTGSVGSVVGAVGSVTGAVGSVTGAVGSVTGNVGGNVVGSVASVTAGCTLTAGERNSVADALLDRANAIETGWTMRQICRILAAALGGKLSGAATATVTVRDVTDTKDRITATVDASGNRTAVTLDGT